MKTLILFLYFVMFTTFASIAAGEVTWLSTKHDFGTFNEDMGTVKCNISFVNTGNDDVVILNVRPTCGCTASDYPHSPIAPGDTAAISIVYNPRERPGHFAKDVIVNTNTDPKRHVLTIEGNVIGASSTIRSKFPISVGNLKIDSSIIPFGEIKKGHTRSAFISGYNQSNDSIKITWENVPSHAKVSCIPAIIPPGGTAAISVFIDSSKNNDWGLSKSSFTIIEPTTKASQQIEIMALIAEDFSKLTDKELKKAPSIKFNETSIDCGTITERNQFITKDFTISNDGKSDLIIRRIYTLDRGIIIDIPQTIIKKNTKSSFSVIIDPRQITGDIINAKLSILTNDPQKSLSTIRIVGEIKNETP